MSNAGTGLAWALANARYWSTVAPTLNAQLRRWKRRAAEIHDPELRALALLKLREERFNTDMAGTFATLAPRSLRRITVETIVALEVMYDYLDLLTEQPMQDPLRDGLHAYLALTDAVSPGQPLSGDYYLHFPADDGGYLLELVLAVRSGLGQLPATATVTDTLHKAAVRCAEAQVRAHAAVLLRDEELVRTWAQQEATASGLEWREFLAGAEGSVLSLHALVAAAADRRTTSAQAAQLDVVYLAMSALATMLDSLVDYQRDVREGELAYIDHYSDRSLLAERLKSVARYAAANARMLPSAAHHVMTITGLVAFYTSAPTARNADAQPVVLDIQRHLRPLITPALAVMRGWRLAVRLRWQ